MCDCCFFRTKPPRAVSSLLALPAAGILAAAAGCRLTLVDFAPRSVAIHTYDLKTPPPPRSQPHRPPPARDWTLVVAPLATAAKYDDRFYYQDGPEIRRLACERWAAFPGPLLAGVFQEFLDRSGRFRHVTAAAAGVPGDLRLAGTVLRFQRQSGPRRKKPAAAVLEVTLTLLAEHRIHAAGREIPPGGTVWSGRLQARAPVASDSAKAFVQAMNSCVSVICRDLLEKLDAALSP